MVPQDSLLVILVGLIDLIPIPPDENAVAQNVPKPAVFESVGDRDR